MEAESVEKGREKLLQAAVAQINSVGIDAVTIESVCREADVAESSFDDCFRSKQQMLLAIGELLVQGASAAVRVTLSRRRSLTETVRLALFAMWGAVEQQAAWHQAANEVTFASLRSAESVTVARAQYNAYHQEVQHLMEAIAEIHGIAWERPVAELTNLMVATIDGLVMGYLVSRDGSAAKQVLELFAYHIAQHGRRTAKNDPK